MIISVASIHLLKGFSGWRPKWTVPFVSEQHDSRDLPLEDSKQPLGWTIPLLVFSGIGLVADSVQLTALAAAPSDFALISFWVSQVIFHSRGEITDIA